MNKKITRRQIVKSTCEHQRRRPACASAQSDQCLFSLSRKYNSLACFIESFNILDVSGCSTYQTSSSFTWSETPKVVHRNTIEEFSPASNGT